jgi:hypothetical protein
MTLYEYLKMSEADYDTYDTQYDTGVTVCYIDTEDDEYEKFCNGIIKKVDVIKINGDILIVNWCELIERNMEKFRKFSMRHWAFEYKHDDDFIYEWIKEIHAYTAGYVSEDFYFVLNEFVDSLE